MIIIINISIEGKRTMDQTYGIFVVIFILFTMWSDKGESDSDSDSDNDSVLSRS